uniref:Uncharacterized protein n=1 Tax=Triticum urartu TaxID=4572 RepID=A0A8R7TRF5_TRIUA
MSQIQAWLCSPSLTDCPESLTKEKRAGAASTIEHPSGNQLSVQNFAVSPLPSETTQAALKVAPTSFSVESGKPCQGLTSVAHLSQGHRHRKASPKSLRLAKPRPPNSLGLQTRVHGSKQCPPFISSSPFQTKPRHLCSMTLIAHTGSGSTDMKWRGRAIRTELVRAR